MKSLFTIVVLTAFSLNVMGQASESSGGPGNKNLDNMTAKDVRALFKNSRPANIQDINRGVPLLCHYYYNGDESKNEPKLQPSRMPISISHVGKTHSGKPAKSGLVFQYNTCGADSKTFGDEIIFSDKETFLSMDGKRNNGTVSVLNDGSLLVKVGYATTKLHSQDKDSFSITSYLICPQTAVTSCDE